ncbi:MAG: PAS domain-containing protein, partial [Spirochaetaceae bacterium]|nr:PAS domain-containing protein [Spirochaetaceae bacterium]
SRRDENVGIRNLIADQRLDLLQKAFAGETVFIPPIVSDVLLPDGSGGMVKDAPTIFIAAPLRADDGSVIAVMTLRFDPSRDFTRLCQVGRIGETGETYTFDQTGLLLSESRFANELAGTGLIGEGETGVLSIRISDPGGDLTKGYSPSRPLSEQPLTHAAASATAGRSGMDTDGYRDYRGVRVLGAWVWNGHLNIGIATEIDEHEALVTHRVTRKVTISFLAIVVLLTLSLVGFMIWNAQRATQALRKARDDWERIAVERTTELRESELQYRSLFEGSQDAVILFVGEGFVHCNRAALEMLGYESEEEFLALHIDEATPQVQSNGRPTEELIQEHRALAQSGKAKLFEFLWRRKDGATLPTEVQL